MLVIFDFEKEPSRMSSSVGVASQKEVVLVRLNSDSKVQISTLKSRIEGDLIARRR